MLAPAIALWLLGSLAPAATSSFEWIVPEEGCPTAQEVRDDVDRILAATPGDVRDDLAQMHATVTRSAEDAWSLDLTITTSRGETRTQLRASRCDTLAEATALFVALATNPEGTIERATSNAPDADEDTNESSTSSWDANSGVAPAMPPPEPEPAEGGAGLAIRRGVRERSAAPKRSQPLEWRLRVVGMTGFGILPSWRGGLGGGVGLLTRYVRVDLQGAYWFPRTTPIENAPGASTVTTAGLGSLRGCPFGRIRGFELGGCLGLEIGRFTVASEGLAEPEPGRELWLTITGDFLVGWHPIDRLMIVFEPGVVFALHRPRFAAEGVGDILQTGPVGLRMALGIEVSL